VWHHSGHIDNFIDPLVECKSCHRRHRADKLIAPFVPNPDGLSLSVMDTIIAEKGIACPACKAKNNFTQARGFNLMFKTSLGATEEEGGSAYLRPETAQGEKANIFVPILEKNHYTYNNVFCQNENF
jgi:glycyl-tRNA synthetase